MSGLIDFESNYHGPEWRAAARAICEENGIADRELERAGGTDHVVFFVGEDLVLKIYRPERNCFERERRSLEFANGLTPFQTPKIIFSGKRDGLDHLLMTRIDGREMTRPEFLGVARDEQVSIVSQLATGLKRLHEHPPDGFVSDWPDFVEERASTFIERQIGHGVNARIIEQLSRYIADSLPLIPLEPSVFLHGDVHFGNLRFDGERPRFRDCSILLIPGSGGTSMTCSR
ncbi:MAG: aminoglycoside phosphotransferase family protein [Acidobacteria bacterium]|nr:aminoglycoside phosphotransferase family protein [Acidobacteriota bacterium]